MKKRNNIQQGPNAKGFPWLIFGEMWWMMRIYCFWSYWGIELVDILKGFWDRLEWWEQVDLLFEVVQTRGD